MRPKARGLAQHGGPPVWLEEIDPAGVILYVTDGPCRPALTDHTNCPGLGLIYYSMYTKHRHELHHAKKAWPGTLADHAFSLVPLYGKLKYSIKKCVTVPLFIGSL
jgi:hypothetical protein